MEYFIIVLVILVIAAVLFRKNTLKPRQKETFPPSWKIILEEKVEYYRNLPQEKKPQFEDDIIQFLNHVNIEGAKTQVDITDKLLVASSAVIPVFGFPEWQYHFLKYVILYPGAFDSNYKLEDKTEHLTGMVGSGDMEGKMILSKPSLHLGFANTRDKKNVGIHEFIHLIDKQDGIIDGIPTFLNENEYVLPWLELIRHETGKILKGENTDLNPYGAIHQSEFLTVTGEYFFEHPHLLEKNHPELFLLLSKAFNQDTTNVISNLPKARPKLGRNDPCHCDSGKKYKHCCLEN